MKRTTYQIIKSTLNNGGDLMCEEIHCLCMSIAKCVDELFRLEECRNIGYPCGKRTLDHRTLIVEVPNGIVRYSIKAVEHIVTKRPPRKYILMPKHGRANDGRPYMSYGDALDEKLRLERITGEQYIIIK